MSAWNLDPKHPKPPAARPPLPFGRIGLALIVLAAVLWLAGCVGSQSQREGKRHRVERYHFVGGVGAFAVDLVVNVTADESSEEAEKHESGIDPAALAAALQTAVKVAVGASTGGISLGLGEIATAAVPLLGAGGLWLRSASKARQREAEARQREDEAWDAERAAQIRAAARGAPPDLKDHA